MHKITKREQHLFNKSEFASEYIYTTEVPKHSPFQTSLTGSFVTADCSYSLISKNPNGNIDMQKIYLGSFKATDEDLENELYYLIFDGNNYKPEASKLLVAKEGRRPDMHAATFLNLDEKHLKIKIFLGEWEIDFIELVDFYFFNPVHKSRAASFTDLLTNHTTYIVSNLS